MENILCDIRLTVDSKMAASIVHSKSQVRVSSVLNRDVKQFGKKFLLDGQDDTCWNSDQGSPQWIQIDLEEQYVIDEIHIQFQGGFAGRDCQVEGLETQEIGYKTLMEFYPEDNNSLQIFKCSNDDPVSVMKIVFNNSTDFFGRITVYKLDILGKPS